MTTSQTQPFEWTNERLAEFALFYNEYNADMPDDALIRAFINSKITGWQVLKIKGEVSDWYYTQSNGQWLCQEHMPQGGVGHDFKTKGMLKGYRIWSVQRLPDKEVFTVGDACLHGTIKSISVDGAMCCVYLEHGTFLIEHVKKQPSIGELLATQHDAIVKYNDIVEFAKKVQMHSVAPGDLAYSALGLTGEAGEVANIVKKLELNIMHPEWVTGESGLKSTEELEHDLLEELGDTIFYAFRIMLDQGINIWHVIDCQARKLNYQSEKYGRTFLK